MRRIHPLCMLVVLLVSPVWGCKHDLDALLKDTVAEPGRGASGSGSGGASSDEDGGVDTGGSSGSDGAGGSGGSGVSQPVDKCNCPALSSELEDKGIENCCRGIAQRDCGLTFGGKALCLPTKVPGRAQDACPSENAGMLELEGCCRPDARCGFQTDGKVLGAFGCIAREEIPKDFFSGVDTTPIACDFECETDADCNALAGSFVCTPNPKNGDQRICAKSCQRDADCAGNRVCAFGVDLAMNRVNAFCQSPIGPLTAGEVCTNAAECNTGVCQVIDTKNTDLGGLCSQLCINDRDCIVGPSCDPQGMRRPMGDEVQEFRVCSNPKAK